MPEPGKTVHLGALDVLTSTPAVLRSMLVGLPEELVSEAGAEGWSAKDVLAHLLSISPKAALQRVRLMLEHDEPDIPNMDEDAVLAASGMRAWPLARLLDEFAAERGERMASLRNLSPEQLARTGKHQVAGLISVADVLNHVAYHDLLHIGQIAGLLAAPIELQRGAMRVF